MRRLTLLALFICLGACSGVADPVQTVQATFESALLPNGSVGGPNVNSAPPSVEVADGHVRVEGVFFTSTPCQTLRGDVVVAGTTARVRITAVTREVNCFTVTASFSYRLESRVPVGITRVTVEHARVFRSQTQSLTVERDVVLAP